ncbi:uncharacterized protein LOC128725073 [Anopheles nili]|uniref:uncharacterized protein LOC128725073 n=1 Tax=Anopheles nili TaxID=185578 RepID=UPI00237B5997|nr:uncharacterized protein LOC128725073 [Anopheles nili]
MKCNFRNLTVAGGLLLGMASALVLGYSSDPHLFENRDGYIIGNYLQATDQDIRDFFWTGSGDGPSSMLKPFERFPISEDAIIKTATVVATVYIDRSSGPNGYDELCIFDCPPATARDDGMDGLLPSDEDEDDLYGHTVHSVMPTDRRFWLMTVIGGLYGPQDHPVLEGRLAKLYRVAFARQQALHLGINGSSDSARNNTLDQRLVGTRRTKRRVVPGNPDPVAAQTSDGPKPEPSRMLLNENVIAYERNRRRWRSRRGRKAPHKRDTRDVLPVPPVVEILGAEDSTGPHEEGSGVDQEPQPADLARNPEDAQDAPAADRTVVRRNHDKGAYSTGRRKVRILIHNTTHLREEDRLPLDEAGRSGNGDGAGMGAAATATANHPANQTEIIYSVFVGGLPVLATTAAEDMKLMSQDEMEHVLETMVYLKADPYLKEPQATPLIPSTQNGSGSVIALIGQNTSLVVVSCVAALLLLLLCAGLFLLARGKRKHVGELKKLESTQALVMPGTITEELNALKTGESPSPYNAPVSVGLTMPKPSPTIHFPLPPVTRPSSSSSSYSSDSSVYYPKRKLKHVAATLHQQHELLDEKAPATGGYRLAKPFHLQSLLASGPGGAENVYASVQKPKKDTHKRRRKYLGENRVGSVEPRGRTPPGTTPTTGSSASLSERSFEGRPPTLVPGPYGQDHGTLNTDVILKHYLRRKPLLGCAEGHVVPVEALNRDRIRALEQCGAGGVGGVSLDSGSIGSYLSMASVKSFPRCFVPEPLSRVLEPVTMTHLDQSETFGEGSKSTGPDTAGTSQYNTDTEVHLARTQSDGADPGVVGPIVWQMHKQELEEMTSPMRDPVLTRNRFEGLLEGAIQLYADGPECEEEQKNSIPLPGVIRPVESRGKSAVVVRETSRSSSATIRPVTAAPTRRHGGIVPISDHHCSAALGGNHLHGAWGSGTHSPMVRPMSAGAYHTPIGLEVTRITAPQEVLQASELSTAPLLQNIMQELKRFRQDQ